jgi:hypothetical protein
VSRVIKEENSVGQKCPVLFDRQQMTYVIGSIVRG